MLFMSQKTLQYMLSPVAKSLERRSDWSISFAPCYATTMSSGFDLRVCSENDIVLQAGEIVKIPTGLYVDLQSGEASDKLAILLIPRSSVSGWILENTVGLVDTDYQGEIFLKVRNFSSSPITLKSCERIAQGILIKSYQEHFNEVPCFSKKTARGLGCDGSTGKF
jgi:dUTP pyrophosphatase